MDSIDDQVGRCVAEAIGEVNGLLDADAQLTDDGATVLVGDGSTLDSLGLVNLAVALEGAVQREFGRHVAIVADVVGASDPAQFGTVGHLVRFVAEKLQAGSA